MVHCIIGCTEDISGLCHFRFFTSAETSDPNLSLPASSHSPSSFNTLFINLLYTLLSCLRDYFTALSQLSALYSMKLQDDILVKNYFHGSGRGLIQVIKLSLSLTNWALLQEDVWRNGCVLGLGASWKWVVSSMPQSLYSQGKSPQVPTE
jgi:hypothetical protein